MKKILLIYLSFFCILNFTPTALAQELRIPLPSNQITTTPFPEPEPVKYELPYPGILPNSPFYTLKLIREGINDLLISDPLDKSNFYLIQADKRIAAFVVLYENGEEELGEETLLKGINYLDKSIQKMIDAKKEQKNVMDIYGKINSSLKKQKEEIEQRKESENEIIAEKLTEDYRRVLDFEKKVRAFSP